MKKSQINGGGMFPVLLGFFFEKFSLRGVKNQNIEDWDM
jgi:hypothetical protein